MLPRPIISALRGAAFCAEVVAESAHHADRPYHEMRGAREREMPAQDFGSVLLRLSTEKWSALSAIIRWRTDADISHAEFWFPKTGWTLGSRFPDGVRWRGPESTSKQSNVLLFTFNAIDSAAKFVAENRIGYRYDTLGIFGIATAKDWHGKRERFCSEAIAEAAEYRFSKLVAADLRTPLFNEAVPVWQVTPRDLMLSPALQCISHRARASGERVSL